MVLSSTVRNGQIFQSEPAITPTSRATVCPCQRSSSQRSSRTKAARPMAQPRAKGTRVPRSRVLTASITCWYWPSTSSRNEPEIPGRIIAMIATAPLQKMVKPSWGMVTGTRVTNTRAAAAPTAIATSPLAPQWAWRAISTIEPTINPKKKANSHTGWAS